MKLIRLFLPALTGLAVTAASSFGQVTLNFANNSGAGLQFNGAASTFQFTSTTGGFQWHVTSPNSDSALLGSITPVSGNSFSYGPITSTGSGITLVQSATVVSPLGNLVIQDGAGNLFSGTINLEDVASYSTGTGGLNTLMAIHNISGVSYNGNNPDLVFLAANAAANVLTMSFQFSPSASLSELTTGAGPFVTSYSGTISVVPEPATLALSALGGLGLVLLRRRWPA